MAADSKTLKIGFLVFSGVTQLDFTGPYEVFTKFPDAAVHIVSKDGGPFVVDGGMTVLADASFASCPALDLICVPGGPGTNAMLTDTHTLDFVRQQAATCRFVTSVCTGALILGAAGLLKGKRATTHWLSHDMLSAFGATPVHARVVKDGGVITGGGVTAGLDFAFVVAAELFGEETAKTIQLALEYDPQPPFDAGTPDKAPEKLIDACRASAAKRLEERRKAVSQAAAKLG